MAIRSLDSLKKRYNSSFSQDKKPIGPMKGVGKGKGVPGGKPQNASNTIKRLLSYVGKEYILLIVVFIFMIMRTISQLIGSYFLRPIINQFLDNSSSDFGRLDLFLQALIILGVIYIIGIFSTYFQNRLILNVSQKTIEKIRNDLNKKVQSLPVRFYDNESKGELMSRFTNDVDNIGTMLDSSLLSLTSGIITLIGTIFMMFKTNIWLSLITVIFSPLFVFFANLIGKKSRKYYSAQQASLGALNGYIEESVTGQKVIKVFCHEDTCIEEFSSLNDDLREKQMHAQFFGGIMGPIMGNLSQISYSITAGVGGILCALGKFDIGGLTVFVNYARHFSMPINEISMQMTTIYSALAGAERVFNILDKEGELDNSEIGLPMPDADSTVKFENVTFGYVPEKVVLKNLSLYAKAGQKIAFVGSTGSGKTTITNLLNRFYDIDEGTITIGGINIKDINKNELRKNIAMVLQDTHLFTGTVMENIRYGRLDATDDEVIEAAKMSCAHNFIINLKNGYDTVLEGDGANLSQGQRQLLNIARAALSKAPILVLDEATSSVDTRTERHIEIAMDQLMKGRTTFVIAHRLSTVINSKAIMVLEQGEIIERGTHEQLLELKGRYFELYTGLKELD